MANSPKRKVNQPKPPAPRQIAEIETEYAKLASQVGQAQYQAYIMTEEVRLLNQQILRLNQEASERRKLDVESAPKAEVTDA